jgi:uncharacterized protein YbjT (DUF2867 family)
MTTIFGATGSTGSHLVKTLLQAGQRVRVAVRDVDKARRLLGPGCEVVAADLARPETLPAALAGSKAVYTAVGGATGSLALVDWECRLIDAARAAGVQHHVKVSGIDSAPEAPSRIQRMHGTIERHLASSGVPFTVLRPSFFMQNFLGLAPAVRAGALPLPTGAGRAGLIDARDIAEVAARVLLDPGPHRGQRYTLTGPELLSHGDAARILTGVLERPVAFVDLPGAAFCQAGIDAGLPAWFAELLTDVYVEVFARDGVARVTDDVPRLLGRPARTLAAFVREHRAAFV